MDFWLKGLWIVMNAMNCGCESLLLFVFDEWIFGYCTYQLVLSGLL